MRPNEKILPNEILGVNHVGANPLLTLPRLGRGMRACFPFQNIRRSGYFLPLARQAHCNAQPNAAGGARDQCGFSVQHGGSLWCVLAAGRLRPILASIKDRTYLQGSAE